MFGASALDPLSPLNPNSILEVDAIIVPISENCVLPITVRIENVG